MAYKICCSPCLRTKPFCRPRQGLLVGFLAGPNARSVVMMVLLKMLLMVIRAHRGFQTLLLVAQHYLATHFQCLISWSTNQKGNTSQNPISSGPTTAFTAAILEANCSSGITDIYRLHTHIRIQYMYICTNTCACAPSTAP